MKNADYFSQYVTEDFEQYINRKRADQCYGNNIEMQAVAEMYNRVIEVYEYSTGEGGGEEEEEGLEWSGREKEGGRGGKKRGRKEGEREMKRKGAKG